MNWGDCALRTSSVVLALESPCVAVKVYTPLASEPSRLKVKALKNVRSSGLNVLDSITRPDGSLIMTATFPTEAKP
jgi:hypothetical protein